MIWSWILNIFGYDFLKNIDDEEIENKKDCGDIEPDNKPEGDKGKDPVTVDKISDEISDNAEEIEVMEQIARDYVDLHMKHYQKNGSRYNYDCLGTALVCEKMFLQQFDKELDTANKWVNKQRPEWVPGIKGAYYNMLGMEEMKNLGDEVSPDELKVGDWIIWLKKKTPWHGHIITVIKNKDSLNVLNGTSFGYGEIREFQDFDALKKSYYKGKQETVDLYTIRPKTRKVKT